MFAQLHWDNSVKVHHILAYIKLLFNYGAVNSVYQTLAQVECVL